MTPHTVQAIIFYALAAVVATSCVVVVYSKNIVHSCFGLFVTLLGVAGLYALLGADFLAVTQVVVYVGGILVLLIFGILLTSSMPLLLGMATRRTYLLATAVGASVFALLAVVVCQQWPGMRADSGNEPTVEALGELLLGKYLFPFEFASLTLLAALLGAAYLVRRDDR